MKIYCCGCEKEIEARLTYGAEIYPHREDLHALPFWVCDTCKGYVGCHHKTKNRTKPLGCIPTKGLRYLRKNIHIKIDIALKSNITRKELYRKISDELGYEYHTADIKSTQEASTVIYFLGRIIKNLT